MDRLMILTTRRFEELVHQRVLKETVRQSREYENDLLKKQTDLAMLQSQINPHFLYNTLECIRGQALEENMDDIANTVKALAQYFRYSISFKSDIVTLEDELKNLSNYVMIQKYRFKDRFNFEIDMPEEQKPYFYKCVLPKLTLQPIVENAIIHGFTEIRSGGLITLNVKALYNNILITIRDNGKGMDKQQLSRYLSQIRGHNDNNVNDTKHNGIGLGNVNTRLQMVFGEEYGVSVSSTSGLGTTVDIFIPYVETHNNTI